MPAPITILSPTVHKILAWMRTPRWIYVSQLPVASALDVDKHESRRFLGKHDFSSGTGRVLAVLAKLERYETFMIHKNRLSIV